MLILSFDESLDLAVEVPTGLRSYEYVRKYVFFFFSFSFI